MSSAKRYRKLNEAFQYVNDEFLDLVEQEKSNGKKKHIWMYLSVIAACICLFFVLPVYAVANNWFGLKDFLLPKRNREITWVTLSGYRESSEAQALAEWEEFLEYYDSDRKIIEALGNNIFFVEGREDWSLYGVYSYEMGEKLDEIIKKYGLKLHTEINVVSPEEMEYRVGGNFLEKSCTKYWGVIYENGTFQLEGDVELDGCGIVSFQFRRSVKGTFDEVLLNIGQAENYTEWQYKTVDKEPVLLVLDSFKSLIFADFDSCFITVNVLCGSDAGMTEEDLQKLADKIDFGILKEVQIPEMRGDSVVLE